MWSVRERIKRLVLLVLALAAVSLPVLMLYHVVIGGANLWPLLIAWAVFHVGGLLVGVISLACFAEIDRRRSR